MFIYLNIFCFQIFIRLQQKFNTKVKILFISKPKSTPNYLGFSKTKNVLIINLDIFYFLIQFILT